METITLTSTAKDGSPLTATYAPDRGMNLISFKKGDIEVIEQSTKDLFEQRNAGLGALIGPHFHRRNPKTLNPLQDKSVFPHAVQMNGEDPFSHGIARYVAWSADATESSISAKLTGSDEWKGTPVKDFEGQDFHFGYDAELKEDGLHITMDVRSDSDSLVGIHYYYSLPGGKGSVESNVKPIYFDQGEGKEIPDSWDFASNNHLTFDLSNEADYKFHPAKDPCRGSIVLNTDKYKLTTTYDTGNEENCWQLWRPKDCSFVCIEPMSAQNPRKPILTVSKIKIHLEIE